MNTAYERLDNGLMGVSSIAKTGKSNQLTRMLTLGGLIELAGTAESTTQMEIPVFSFYTFHKTLETNSIYNTTALSGDLAALLHPKAGMQFSYVHDWVSKQVSTSNPASFKNVLENVFNVTCTVAGQTVAAMPSSGSSTRQSTGRPPRCAFRAAGL